MDTDNKQWAQRVGNIWLVLGVLAIAGGGLNLLHLAVVGPLVECKEEQRAIVIGVSVQTLFGMLIVPAAIQFTRGKVWAGIIFEILSWVGLAGVSVFSVIWFRSLSATPGASCIRSLMLFMGAVIAVGIVIFFVCCIYLLRGSRRIRKR